MFDLFAPIFCGFVPCECDFGLCYIIITGTPIVFRSYELIANNLMHPKKLYCRVL
jgi:hypothetical protein